jgi:hypothetical protein
VCRTAHNTHHSYYYTYKKRDFAYILYITHLVLKTWQFHISAKYDLVYSLLTFHAESYFCPFWRIDWFAIYIWLDVFCRQIVFICSKYYRILNRRCPEEPPLISIWNGDLVYSVWRRKWISEYYVDEGKSSNEKIPSLPLSDVILPVFPKENAIS